MEKKIIKIAFDVSTNQSGFAMFINNELVDSGAIKQEAQDKSFANRLAIDLVKIDDAIIKFFYRLMKVEAEVKKSWEQCGEVKKENYRKKFEEVLNNSKIIVIFEANKILISQETKQKLDIYLGAFVGIVVEKLNLLVPSIPKEYKFALPGEWHRLTFGVEYKRDEGKQRSIAKALSIMSEWQDLKNDFTITDDEADAINIANIAEELRDMGIVKSQLQYKAKRLGAIRPQILKIKAQIYKLESEAEARDKAGKQKWLSQKFIQYHANIEALEKLQKEKEELQNGQKRN